ncbi:MAG: hypothetical protein B7C54_03005 [Acidimicrobiales bacterium mtb01]|nr:class I SAM-dependent methyltransferase [Actinomycetota bacterium]TEX47262.1 MAG: hypothetical protein B7C54_03005 [Acidimicrobiales bacterium mtb01]
MSEQEPIEPQQVLSDAELVETFYRDCYHQVFDQQGFAGSMYRRTHRLVERGVDNSDKRILEIGAGKGEHLAFVRGSFSEYVMLEPNQTSRIEADEPKVRVVAGRAEDTDFPPESFDRVISMCVLHHVDDVAQVLRNIRSWLAPGGVFSLFLPSDPGVLNRLNRRLFVTPRARRAGFDSYPLINAREHKNHYWAIKTELDHQFSGFGISRRYFPLPIPAGNLSLCSIWHLWKPSSD